MNEIHDQAGLNIIQIIWVYALDFKSAAKMRESRPINY